MKKLLIICLVFIFLIPDISVKAIQQEDLYSFVEAQVKAYADSIDQKNVDDNAAKILAKHGLTSRKKLSVKSNHALTATLMNGNLSQEMITEAYVSAIKFSQQLSLPQVYDKGEIV